MRTVFLPLLLSALSASSAFGQHEADTNAFDGKWNVSIQSASGRPHVAKLVLADFAGTWVDSAATSRTKAKACSGKKFPVTMQKSQAAELEFTVWGSSTAAVCPDISVTVRPVSPKLLEGTLASGESIRLTRP